MLSIDEAIAHAREVAEEQRKDNGNCEYKAEYGCKGCADYYSKPCIECAEEHEQLADWLEELKDYRENQHRSLRHMYEKGYNKALDDFVKFANTMPTVETDDGEFIKRFNEFTATTTLEIAEQLKAGVTND